MNYRTPQQREQAHQIAYHTACADQYTEAANGVCAAYPKLRQRALDNAHFHLTQLSYITERTAA